MKQNKKILFLTQAAVIAALYAALTVGQDMLLPGTTSMAVQFRVSEALTLLACLKSAAIPGLIVGCFLANLINLGWLPTDIVFGTVATLLAAITMYLLRKALLWKLPLAAALMPALFNGLIIGAQIEAFAVDGPFRFKSFAVTAGCVALGELAVCFTLGLLLYKALDRPQFKKWLR
ncbi:MAG: QueT transporter family protein [Clostridia bacterium]|nr:QueT transporter family protein [Clostridia bacterium]